MKFVLSMLMAVVGQAAAADVRLNSSLGKKIMTNARRLENNNEEYYDAEADNTWLTNYSIKFQGCHSQLQMNQNAEEDGSDAMIYNKQLARFRLCASDSCDSSSAGGCSNKAEYVVEMSTFADAWTEAAMEAQEYKCEKYRENFCDCDDSDDADACQYQCFANAGMQYCQQNDEDEEEFEVQRYLECAQMDQAENNAEEGGNYYQAAEVAYYVGPYCSDDGSKVLLGVFTDDTCSVSASTSIYAQYNNGVTLPYSSQSIVSLDCMSCKEEAEDNGDDADANDADEVKEMCGDLYEASGKCEQDFDYSSDNDACNFIQGIQVKRSAGDYSYSSTPSKAAGAFIGIFAVSTILLAAYVYYLHSKLQRAQVALH